MLSEIYRWKVVVILPDLANPPAAGPTRRTSPLPSSHWSVDRQPDQRGIGVHLHCVLDNLSDRRKRLCLVSWAAAPCV